jgi:hypothetical protein
MDSKTKILIGVLVVSLLLIGVWWVLTSKNTHISDLLNLKSCSEDSDCIVVESIGGLDHIPTSDEFCGCECVTSINKKFNDFWEQKIKDAECIESRRLCKQCAFVATNSKAICENNLCKLEIK